MHAWKDNKLKAFICGISAIMPITYTVNSDYMYSNVSTIISRIIFATLVQRVWFKVFQFKALQCITIINEH